MQGFAILNALVLAKVMLIAELLDVGRLTRAWPLIVTILVGIAGALLAGFVAQSMGWSIDRGWQSYGAATLGAIILLALYRMVVSRRT